MPMEKTFIPFGGSYITRDFDAYNSTDSARDPVTYGFMPIKIENALTGKQTVYVDKAPAFDRVQTTVGSYYGGDLKVWQGMNATPGQYIISSWADASVRAGTAFTNAKFYYGSVSIGTVTFGAAEGIYSYISECLLAGTSNIIFAIEKNTATSLVAYHYPEGGALTQITTIPTNCVGNFVHLNGYSFILAKDGKIYNSTLNDVSAGYTDFTSADSLNDRGVGLARLGNSIAAVGQESIEVFTIVENATGSPLQKQLSIVIEMGGVAAKSIVEAANAIYFFGQARGSGAIGIFKLDSNFKLEKISTPFIDRFFLPNFEAVNSRRAPILSSTAWAGKEQILACSPSAQTGGKTWSYDVETGSWWEPPKGSAIIVEGTSLLGIPYVTVDSSSAGGVEHISHSVGLTYNTNNLIITSPITFDTENLKTFEYLQLKGVAGTATNNISIAWSDDYGYTWSSSRTVNLASGFTRISGLGAARHRMFRFISSSTTPCRLEGFELGYTIGSS